MNNYRIFQGGITDGSGHRRNDEDKTVCCVQCGAIFYVPAGASSVSCPRCGTKQHS